jgi:hypothetical protein
MKPVYPLGILAALSLVACTRTDASNNPAAPSSAESSAPAEAPEDDARRTTKLDLVPSTIRPLLPKHGMYAAGGGNKATAWRTVVDLSAETVTTSSSQTVGALWFGKLDHEVTRPITEAEHVELIKLAERAWHEAMPTLTNPTNDYDEVLVAVDGDDVFFQEGYGPIRPPKAAALVNKLKAIAVPPLPTAPPATSAAAAPKHP